MRLQLVLLLWFALTAWSSQVDASAMAHCQTHEMTEQQAVSRIQATSLNITGPAVEHHQHAIIDHNRPAPVATNDVDTHHTHLHDCCDQSTQHHCSGSCPSCDSCSTAHGAAMPTVWLLKTVIAQQKIQYFDHGYLRSQSSTQERPPKN